MKKTLNVVQEKQLTKYMSTFTAICWNIRKTYFWHYVQVKYVDKQFTEQPFYLQSFCNNIVYKQNYHVFYVCCPSKFEESSKGYWLDKHNISHRDADDW